MYNFVLHYLGQMSLVIWSFLLTNMHKYAHFDSLSAEFCSCSNVPRVLLHTLLMYRVMWLRMIRGGGSHGFS